MVQKERKDFPLTDDEVLALLNWQTNSLVHPFTCKTHSTVSLIPTNHSWVCPVQTCNYKQFWCHEQMLHPVNGSNFIHYNNHRQEESSDHKSGVSSGIPDHLIKRDR